MKGNRSDVKLQRWIDLLAELLTHKYGLTLDQLCGRVPGYTSGGGRATVARMFERDKEELRAMGVPIETIEPRDGDDEPQRYRVDPREMYLPFLTIAAAGNEAAVTAHTPEHKRRLRSGYRGISSLAFEPDELAALARGAQLAMSLDDSTLASDARAALRKLAYDFPVDVGLGESPATIIPPRERATAARLGMVGQALLRLKRVSFTYRGMTRDVTLPRTVEPYGLFFQSGHWYLAARDAVNGDLRNFRVSRMRDISVNARRAQSRDYEIPGTFRLADHAGDRSAWELGDGDPQQMVVEFRGSSGAATAALRLGSPSPLGERFRAFQVRRPDVFARWVLSFAGEAVPVSPPRFVEKCRTVARDTLTVYGDGQ